MMTITVIIIEAIIIIGIILVLITTAIIALTITGRTITVMDIIPDMCIRDGIITTVIKDDRYAGKEEK